jgi:hypothetical protein
LERADYTDPGIQQKLLGHVTLWPDGHLKRSQDLLDEGSSTFRCCSMRDCRWPGRSICASTS